jgi:O-antigen ligase
VALFIVTWRRSRGWIVSAVISIVLIIAIAPVFVTYEGAFYQLFARGDTSRTLSELDGRQRLWEYVWENDVAQRPWLGVGFGSYWTTTRLPAVWRAAGWKAPFAHNGYLDELAATGAIGLFLFSGFIVTCFTAMARRSSAARGGGAAIITGGWLILFLLINATDTILQFYFKAPFIFTLAAVSCCSVALSPRTRGQLWHRYAPTAYRFQARRPLSYRGPRERQNKRREEVA